MVYIKQVRIKDFKNFSNEETFTFDKNINLIAGKNGIGKTTILDAIIWAIKGRLLSGAQDGWKPKELHIDSEGNPLSKVKDLFNTLVEVTIGFDDGQKDILIKRTSCCGRSTVLYYNNITDTQKQVNKYLESALGFDLSKLLIYTNPEILFNPDEVSQQECGKLIYDSVYNSVQNELADLYSHLFDNYNTSIDFLEDNTLEKTIAKKLVSNIKRKLDNKTSENIVIEELQEDIDNNVVTLNVKNESIKSQELILNDYYQKLKQEKAYKELEANLDKQEQLLRQQLFEKSKLVEELNKINKTKNELIIWLNDFNELLTTNPSNDQIKIAFGIKINKPIIQNTKINVLKQEVQKLKCPICGNWYVPKKEEPSKDSVLNKLNKTDNQKQIINNNQANDVFDYLPKLQQIKQQIADLKQQSDQLSDKVFAIDKNICLLEYKSIAELQIERNNISKYFASLDQGKAVQKQVNNMKATCEECSLNNKYMNILLELLKNYVKQKLRIIMQKLNQNLTSGMIALFKLQTNGTLKECVTIIDKSSNASYAETNQSNKIKLGIEVCKILQDFNNVNIPIFIDEIGRFNDYSFIKDIKHQIIATLPTNENTINIRHTIE